MYIHADQRGSVCRGPQPFTQRRRGVYIYVYINRDRERYRYRYRYRYIYQPTVFLMSDMQIKEEALVEDLNNLLNAGEARKYSHSHTHSLICINIYIYIYSYVYAYVYTCRSRRKRSWRTSTTC